ncbi:MAG: hypothetical protein AB1714_08045 [Acidobacteriota bacterium]
MSTASAGWVGGYGDEERVRRVIAHYDAQTADEQLAQVEAAMESEGVTLMAIPTNPAADVRAFLAQKKIA